MNFLNKIKNYNYLIKLLFLTIFIFYSIIKLDPDVIIFKFFFFHEYGNFDRYIINILNEIEVRKIENSVFSFLPIWQDINPGLFYFFSKLIIETTNKYELIIIFNIILQLFGVFLFYNNIKKLISRDVALISTFLIIITPFFIFYSGTIHETNQSFFFLNLFIYYFLKSKNEPTFIQTIFLIILIILACSNYWVNFIFIQLFLVYFYIDKQKLNVKFLPLVLFPLIFLIIYLFMLTILYSSPDILIEKFLGRTLDIRVGTNFSNIDKVLNLKKIILYPVYLDHRIRTMLNFGLFELFILLALLKFNNIEIKKKNIVSFNDLQFDLVNFISATYNYS